VKNQNREAAAVGESLLCGCEVAGKDVGFADSIIAEEAIGSLCVGPILAGPRRSCAYLARQLLQKLSKTLAMALILEIASHNLIVYPVIPPEIRRRLPASQPLNLSPIPHGKHFAMVLQSNVST
jgi:hypothetical protein